MGVSTIAYEPIPFDHTYVLYNPSDPISLISAIFSLLPIEILIFYFSWFLITREIEPVIIAFGQVINDIINNIIKHLIKQERPRPEFLSVGIFKANGTINTGSLNKSLEYGMPSAHSQFMGFFCCYFLLKIIYQWPNLNKLNKFYLCFIFIICSIGVVFSRIYLMYHTIEQTLVGVIFGCFLGSCYFLIVCIARDIGIIRWIVNWNFLQKFYIKDSCYECPLSFKAEYDLWHQRKAKRCNKIE
ncbi:hypothetical protein PACTADRAFT_76238 [Pachysolen tannophilus NRRL Y-2460]|uniref:Phosphatidic acid phosphatase type 2/haloperoxidase domain-containing protein n=1 Tax=Pachysolen tannophilus NRRL Y-2460 TaxID=669874 RepID=A0A1E4TS92_PACTA|nr:hypothetical protein PACTADRAFT_76238 [Pachysolen tannophilus NRRL Y-2460]